MSHLCDVQIHVNNQQIFYLNQELISTYSPVLKKNSVIQLHDFPGGPNGFELVSRFSYNNGRIIITFSNICLLHCCAIFLCMTENLTSLNLLTQTENFLQGMFDWSWNDVLQSLKSCESFFPFADSVFLIEKLTNALIEKITHNSDFNPMNSFSPSSSSPDSIKPYSSTKSWWFDDMTILPPKFIQKFLMIFSAYSTENNTLILTRFLLHYLKTSVQQKVILRPDFHGLANTAVYGVILVAKTSFSCRKLFWVLRILSNFKLSKVCRTGLEKLIGEMLDVATLDDLLVSAHDNSAYDVNLVVRLVKAFVNNSDGMCVQKLKKVGELIDKYLSEISPDQNLKLAKFIKVAESIPDYGRDCYDDVYRAIEVYFELHPNLSMEERSRLCQCLNFQKLTLQACKDLAINPRIPPEIAVRALISKRSNIHVGASTNSWQSEMAMYDMRLNLQRMQWRVAELEKVCRDMERQISPTLEHGSVVANSTSVRYKFLSIV